MLEFRNIARQHEGLAIVIRAHLGGGEAEGGNGPDYKEAGISEEKMKGASVQMGSWHLLQAPLFTHRRLVLAVKVVRHVGPVIVIFIHGLGEGRRAGWCVCVWGGGRPCQRSVA